MFLLKIKKILYALAAAGTLSMLSSGCTYNTGSGAKDTVYINNGGGGGSGNGKALIELDIDRDTTNGTYYIEFEGISIYPFPKFLVNGIEISGGYYSTGFEIWTEGVPSGDLTYSVIWDGDTLTRTINLPNNTYRLVKDSTETQYRFSITGYKGDEKVIWAKCDNNYKYTYDTLSVNQEFVFSKDYRFGYCEVKPKDFKPLGFGYSATAESKKIAVYEDISLWGFR
jgi:hypothetical protein